MALISSRSSASSLPSPSSPSAASSSWDFEQSYYEASVSRPPPGSALAGDISADVCIIGGGFTGLSCALELALNGRRVLLLESRAFGWGASGRSGGQFLHGFATQSLSAIAKTAQVSEKSLFDFSLTAIEQLQARVKKHHIECDLQNGYAEAAVKPAHLRAMAKWAERAARVYDYPHNTVLNAPRFREVVTSRAYCGGLINDISGHLHPLKYLLGLAAAAKKASALLFENTTALNINSTRDGVTVHTSAGIVRASQVLVACNAYADNLLPPVAARVMPVGTYIGATSPLGKAAETLIRDNRGVCDSNFVLDYYRLSADARLLFGGRVSYSTRPPADLHAALRARMLHVFPQLTDSPQAAFEYVWGGNVAITMSRFPDIGRVTRNVYYAHGFSGHGVALSGFAGKIIADAMRGDSENFDVFTRVRHRAFPGGALLRMPLLVLAMLYYRLRDIL